MLLNSLVLPNGIWQMQVFQINQSEDSSKITIMSDTTCGHLHQCPITSASNYNSTTLIIQLWRFLSSSNRLTFTFACNLVSPNWTAKVWPTVDAYPPATVCSVQSECINWWLHLLQWCETQRDCNRLRLIDILVRPMQRLTKYSLLLKAVLKKTDDVNQKKDLAEMVRHFRRQRIYLLTGSDEGRFAKFSKSRRRPLLGPSHGWKRFHI